MSEDPPDCAPERRTLACADLMPDGLHISGVRVICLDIEVCKVKGCIWRRWHVISPDSDRSLDPPKYYPFLDLV